MTYKVKHNDGDSKKEFTIIADYFIVIERAILFYNKDSTYPIAYFSSKFYNVIQLN